MTQAQDIFELKCMLTNIKIKLCARIESGVKQLLALITSSGDLVLHYTYGEVPPVLKRIPWLTDTNKVIQAICFDPTATWLLAAAADGSLYIIPALSLVDKKQKIDCKWSLNDYTHFPKHSQTPDAKPTTVVWWQTLDCNQNALVGYENGAISLISLTDGRCLGCCAITEPVAAIFLCQDHRTLTSVSLLIDGESGQQWRLILEQASAGYSWPPEPNSQTDDSARSRLNSLKQMGVDKLTSLKQRLVDGRSGAKQDNVSDTTSESSQSESVHSGPELLPGCNDTYFSPQCNRNGCFFTAFYKASGLITVHEGDIEAAPYWFHKVLPNTSSVVYATEVLFAVNDTFDLVSIISRTYSEKCKYKDESFNDESILAQFRMDKENVMCVFTKTDLALTRPKKKKEDKKEKQYELATNVVDLRVHKPKFDTCVIVTNNSVYKVVVKCPPVTKFVQLVTEENNLERAEWLASLFKMNTQQLLEGCGDLMLSRGSFHSGIILYKRAKVHLLKRVLKLAISADCRTLLKFVHLCLAASRVDMSIATKIHIGNLAVMAYTELILRYGGAQRATNTKDFMNFLRFEEFYDQVLAVNVACQAGHWNIVTLLAKSRGLQLEAVAAFGQILNSARAPRPTDHEFLFALSEPSLTQALLLFPHSSREIFTYIRTNVEMFPLEILYRLAAQLDPSQPSVTPLAAKMFRTNKYCSALDSTIDSIEMDNPDTAVTTVKDLIETFLVVLIYLVGKTDKTEYNLELLEKIEVPEPPPKECSIKRLPDLRPVSCGFEHAAFVRNSCLYTMGLTTSGCLGVGPLLTQSGPPKPVQTLCDLRVKVLTVSCGRKHTLALTDYGVYSWGSNKHGQLGLGPTIQESPYPQLVTGLQRVKIIDVAAGQYHSVALTLGGRVYTWGWGVHGQLGQGNCDNFYYPKLLPFKRQVVQVAAGHAHTLLLTNEGKLFGFGSNMFGQLESCQLETNKATKPVRVLLEPDIDVPIEKISTAYFHNVAVRADQEVYTWGASPQEVRILQSKNARKPTPPSERPPETWRSSVCVYSGGNKRPIKQVAVGYRNTAVIHRGVLLCGKNKDANVRVPTLETRHSVTSVEQKVLHVACGLNYTMCIDQYGNILAWGSPTIAQTILGRPSSEWPSENKFVVMKNTRRVVKVPCQTPQYDHFFQIDVPGLPSMEITYNSIDPRLSISNAEPYAILAVENGEIGPKPPNFKNQSPLVYIKEIPSFKWGQKTLHYVLETYHGFYDTEIALTKCLDSNNYQAASKIAMLDGHFGDSLGFQLTAFKKHMESADLDLESIFVNKEAYDVKEKEQNFVELVVKNIQEDLNEKNLTNCQSPAHILSSSSSLDSIRQWGDEVEHQGGRESPCEMSDMGDVRQNMTHYVQSLTSDGSPPISSVSRIIDNIEKTAHDDEEFIEIKDGNTKEIIRAASKLIEFYIKKIYVSENHILMQNVLMKCIEFWLTNNLPVPILENILLKNMDKYFYPLSILLFCKNFSNGLDEEIIKRNDSSRQQNSAGFLKEFSTKFCLQLCSMVLENVNKS